MNSITEKLIVAAFADGKTAQRTCNISVPAGAEANRLYTKKNNKRIR